MAAKWKEPARDALDTLVLNHVDIQSLDSVVQLNFIPFDPMVKRTEGYFFDFFFPTGFTLINIPHLLIWPGTVQENGKVFKTTKGAPHVLMKLIKDESTTRRCEDDVHKLGLRGIRALAVAKTDGDGDNWKLLGLLTFLDPPRHDTKETIRRAINFGVEVTGDLQNLSKCNLNATATSLYIFLGEDDHRRSFAHRHGDRESSGPR